MFADPEQRLAVMSIGFLLKNQNDSIVWRGPKKTGMIKQFLTDVVWQDIDYLIIDTPPGTSDEHITVMENLKLVKNLAKEKQICILSESCIKNLLIMMYYNGASTCNCCRNVNCDGAIIVTTPQAVAVDDVLREVTFCRKTGIPIIGIIENMSGFICPSCTVSIILAVTSFPI